MVEASIVKKEQAVEAFKDNVTRSVVCDMCLQPIDAVHSSQSLIQLKTDLATSFDEREHILKVREIVDPLCICRQPEC
jgi:hypothetical protein